MVAKDCAVVWKKELKRTNSLINFTRSPIHVFIFFPFSAVLFRKPN